MSCHIFTLQPFPLDPPLPGLQLTGEITRRGPLLVIRYELRGPLDLVSLPPTATHPERKRGLWEETCFEFFLGIKDDPGYWEFNLSPADHWNVYRFAAYRQGMAEEPAFAFLPLKIQRQPQSLALALEISTAPIIHASQVLEMAVAAVIKLSDGALTYWALAHPGPRPDFHRRDGFLISV